MGRLSTRVAREVSHARSSEPPDASVPRRDHAMSSRRSSAACSARETVAQVRGGLLRGDRRAADGRPELPAGDHRALLARAAVGGRSGRRARSTRRCRRCCSCASTTPGEARSPPRSPITYHNGWVGVRCAGAHPEEQIDPVVVQALRRARRRRRRGVPQAAHRGGGPRRRRDRHAGLRGRVPGLSGPPLPRIGRSQIPPGSRWRRCARSATRSITASGICSRRSFRRSI